MIETVFNIEIFDFDDGDCCEEGYNYFNVIWRLQSLEQYNGYDIVLNQNQDVNIYDKYGNKKYYFNLFDNVDFRKLLIEKIESKKVAILPFENHYEDEGGEPYIKYACSSCKGYYQLIKKEDCPNCGQKIIWK